ncbi:MAG TPA: SCO family protein [bacterium]|jgi:protein SCO1/2|nr:SCO family protein [bacterium]
MINQVMVMRFALKALAAVLAAIAVATGPAATAAPPFPVIGKAAPDFTLTSQSGAPVRLGQFRGKLVVLDFIYTHCTDVCPLVTANLARVQRDLTARGWWVRDVVFVSVTTDPAHDTPGVLRTYARRYQADPRGWSFLTGPERTLAAVYKAYDIVVRPASQGLQEHALPVFVIDRRGVVLGAYGYDFKPADMLNDLAHLR